MKLLVVIGCFLASAYSANLEGLGSDQYFERTPNNNLVQIKYISVQGGGLYDNRQLASSQSYGHNDQFNNQFSDQVSQDPRFQNQFNNQNQRINQFSQQSHGFNPQTGPFSFNNNEFPNPNLVEISFDEARYQQYLQNQERQRQYHQRQHQDFQNHQSQRNEFQAQQKKIQDFQSQDNQNVNTQSQLSQLSQQNPGFSATPEPFSFSNYQFANPNLVQISIDENRRQQFLKNQETQKQEFPSQKQTFVQRQQPIQENQFIKQNQQHLSQTQTKNGNPFFNNRAVQQSSTVESNPQNNRITPGPERVQSSLIPHGSQLQHQRPIRINHGHFQHGQRFPSSAVREISGHLQRVNSDEILGIFQPFFIPASASLFEGNVNSQFICFYKGFFADPINNCQQFHVCTRVQGRNTPDLYRFTFQCAEGEYFDQIALTCLPHASPARRCSCTDSPSLYQISNTRALQFFKSFSPTPYTLGTTPPGICYLANKAHFVTGIRRK